LAKLPSLYEAINRYLIEHRVFAHLQADAAPARRATRKARAQCPRGR
jgi:hypothetical protein